MRTNTTGTLNLLEAFRRSGQKPKFLFVSSSEVYDTSSNDVKTEDSITCPQSPYAVSKLAAEHLVLVYGFSYDIPIFIVRPVPHIGTGQSKDFSIMDFCSQAFQLKKEKIEKPTLTVGNIDVLKEFMDVRDVVEAYFLVMEKGTPGEIYNINSGRRVRIREIIEILKKSLSFEFDIKQDKARMRPHDPDIIEISSEKIRSLGWSPRHSLEDSIRSILQNMEDGQDL
jgi:GDP-4-dehydro-6-deoxy-D-mannose reductase